jgi:chromosome partitioning protein
MAIAKRQLGGERTLLEALEQVGVFQPKYDFLLLDTAPGWDSLTIAALFCADEVLAPVSLEVASVLGLLEFSKSLEAPEVSQEAPLNMCCLPSWTGGCGSPRRYLTNSLF